MCIKQLLKFAISTSTKNYISDLLEDIDDIFFVSPHFDDAVLSSGALITHLTQVLKKKVTVITVFTKASKKPYSSQGMDYIRKCGFESATVLFQTRRQEDIEATRYLGCGYIHLNYQDAAFRKNNKGFVYPSAQDQFSGKISTKDKNIILCLKRDLKKIIDRKSCAVFSPIGVGGHADHCIVRDVVLALNYCKRFYWEDFPYNLQKVSLRRFWNENNYRFKKIFLFQVSNSMRKEEAIKKYKTQIFSLFAGKKIPNTKEAYYNFEKTSSFRGWG